jgi:hypothetical protein
MSGLEQVDPDVFLSELYAGDCGDAVLLTEYPSSNSDQTQFQNRTKYIIHDPDPPPRRALLKVLGPHHLMCGWGDRVPVCSDVPPPQRLMDHWRTVFGSSGVPHWLPTGHSLPCITLFPHQTLPESQQVIDPAVNYRLHSKEVIEKIDCAQAPVLTEISVPCVLKLTHGYAGLSNFFIRKSSDVGDVLNRVTSQWPDAKWVINGIIDDIVHDWGVQFYLRKDGSPIWLGFTEQRFDAGGKWSGGVFSAAQQSRHQDSLEPIIAAAANYLHSQRCFGVVGIDVVTDSDGRKYLVDVNPRLTGITPFLMASRRFAAQSEADFGQGIYMASSRFPGTLDELIEAAEAQTQSRVVVLSAYQESDQQSTLCHLSVTSNCQTQNQQTLDRLLKS